MSALADRNGLPLGCTVSAVNSHDSRLYEPTLEAFEIPEVEDRPAIISAGAAYDVGRFVSTIRNGESRVASPSTGEPGDFRHEGNQSGLIQNSTRSTVQ